jgi:hypothetical protein
MDQKEKPRLSAGPSSALSHQSGLAVLIRVLLALTVRVLTVRILLLLARLAAATLLLAGFLTRVLVLLARIRVLVGHVWHLRFLP